ncbi:hypothetical protein [Pseudomonas laurentiana]
MNWFRNLFGKAIQRPASEEVGHDQQSMTMAINASSYEPITL